MFYNWVCEQAYVGGSIVQGFELTVLQTVVRNPDPEEKNATYRNYLLEAYSNNAAFVNYASHAFGLPIQLAGNLSAQITPAPGDQATIEFTYPPGTDNYHVKGAISAKTIGSSEGTIATYTLNETKLARFFVSYEGPWDPQNSAVIDFGPDSYWGRHSEVRSWEEVFGMHRFDEASLEIWFDAAYSARQRASTTDL